MVVAIGRWGCGQGGGGEEENIKVAIGGAKPSRSMDGRAWMLNGGSRLHGG